MHHTLKHNRQNVSDGHIAKKEQVLLSFLFTFSQVYLFIHHLTVQDLKGVEVDALVEREDSVSDSGVVGQTQVFLRGT